MTIRNVSWYLIFFKMISYQYTKTETVFINSLNCQHLGCYPKFLYLLLIAKKVFNRLELGTRRNDYGRRCHKPDSRPESLTPRRSPSAATRGPLSIGGGWWRLRAGSTPCHCGQRTRTSRWLRSSSEKCEHRDPVIRVARFRWNRKYKFRRRVGQHTVSRIVCISYARLYSGEG